MIYFDGKFFNFLFLNEKIKDEIYKFRERNKFQVVSEHKWSIFLLIA